MSAGASAPVGGVPQQSGAATDWERRAKNAEYLLLNAERKLATVRTLLESALRIAGSP